MKTGETYLKNSENKEKTNSIIAPKVSLPSGGGAIKGIGEKYEVNGFTGTGSFSIPIYTSPSRDLQPDIDLNYNSGNGNGIFGLGFSLSLSSITRKVSENIPKYDDTDTFIFSGADDLVIKYVKDSMGNWVKEEKRVTILNELWEVIAYRPRTEGGYLKIERWTCIKDSTSYWQVTDRNNTITVFGKTEGCRISDPMDKNRIYEWLIEEVTDSKGNKIMYNYKAEDGVNVSNKIYENNRSRANKYIKSIQYGNYMASGVEKFAFEIVFDYGERPNIDYPTHNQCTWEAREDAFSTYLLGFELRTYRLCKNIFMIHHLEKENNGNPFCVRITHFEYMNENGISFLKSVEEIGCEVKMDGTYNKKHMPPNSFKYTLFNPKENLFKPIEIEGISSMPNFLDNTGYMPVDLYGEGIPGFLYSNNQTTFYIRPKGNGRYSYDGDIYSFPIHRDIQKGVYSIEDLNGNGTLDFTVYDSTMKGYYRLKEDGSFEPFQSFFSLPTDMANPKKEFVDLNGDGKGDLLVYGDNTIKYYPSLGEEGYGLGVEVSLSYKPDKASDEEFNGFVNVFGDGLMHRVRIKNGFFECCPNLGYGKFGAPILLDNAPRFNSKFDPSRLLFMDIDGSGTTDLAYIYQDRVEIFKNINGNSFEDAIVIELPTTYDKLSQVTFADVTGSGCASMIITKLSPNLSHMYCDFCGETKPYLLSEIINNLGATTQIFYTSSTKQYLADKERGYKWKTKLCFPVHVIEKVETIDEISGGKFVVRYRYHDGCYDNLEKEFRGFGFVETFDTEEWNTLSNISKDLYVPPVYTKHWYHTGVYQKHQQLSKQYEREYYKEDTRALVLTDSKFEAIDDKFTSEVLNEACISLRGMLLREEIYAIDNTALEPHPYFVKEFNYKTKQLQPIEGENKSSFFVHERENIQYHYERNPNDPRVAHSFALDMDEYGNEISSCNIVYPRRNKSNSEKETPLDKIYEEQLQLKAIGNLNSYINKTENTYLLGLEKESKVFELLEMKPQNMYFSWEEVKIQFEKALENTISFHENVNSKNNAARLLNWERYIYWNENLDAPLNLGEVSNIGLIHHTENAVMPEDMVRSTFQWKVTEDMLKNDGMYINKENYWWKHGLVAHYKKDCFYMLYKTVGRGGDITEVEYDKYGLLPTVVIHYLTDTLKDKTSFVNDYKFMQPYQTKDMNDIVSEVKFDPMGMVIAQTVYGDLKGQPIGDEDLSKYKVLEGDFDDILKNPHKYLQKTTSYFFYDLKAWMFKKEPAVTVTLMRHTHENQLKNEEKTQITTTITYSDGFGRVIETKIKGDNDPITNKEQYKVSGKTVYNNKGAAAKVYLPYFDDNPYYKNCTQQETPTIITYDPILRPIREDTPKGFFTKVEFTPWMVLQYDENDTVKESSYYLKNIENQSEDFLHERDALKKSEVFYNTPECTILDSLGNSFIKVSELIDKNSNGQKEYLITKSTFDIQGNLLSVKDPRLDRVNMSQIFDMEGNVLYSYSVDAGEHYSLSSIYGDIVHAFDGRYTHISYYYDVLRRPLKTIVSGNNLNDVVEKFIYGDSIEDAKDYNLWGKIYSHYDQSGRTIYKEYDLEGRSISSSINLREGYKEEANWERDRVEEETFDIYATYNVLGNVVSETEPNKNVYLPQYNSYGELKSVIINFADGSKETLIKDIQYDAKGQRSFVMQGNGVKVFYTYEPNTLRLTRIQAKRSQNGNKGNIVLQDMSYVYDPVGNVTRMKNEGQQIEIYNQQVVKPISDYTYDSLYRLIEAQGRQNVGVSAADAKYKQEYVQYSNPLLYLDDKKLEMYKQFYTYDKGGNLIKTQHMSASGSWTQEVLIDDKSNRGILKKYDETKFEDVFYDSNGNMKSLDNLKNIKWNYRNNISSLDVVVRRRIISDSDYYVYDSSGSRVRKVSEKYINEEVNQVEEKIYIGTFEIKRIYQVSNEKKTKILERYTHHIENELNIFIWKRDDNKRETDNIEKKRYAYQYSNNIGSSCLEVDENAEIITYEEYYPYGGSAIVAGKNEREVSQKEYGFCNKEKDSSTGLYYYGMRYYAPWLTRWLSADPAGFIDGPNLYAYVGGNPVTMEDVGGMARRSKSCMDKCGITHQELLEATFKAADEAEKKVKNKKFINKNSNELIYDAGKPGGMAYLGLVAVENSGEKTFSVKLNKKTYKCFKWREKGGRDAKRVYLTKVQGEYPTYEKLKKLDSKKSAALLRVMKGKTYNRKTNIDEEIDLLVVGAASETHRSKVGGILLNMELNNIKHDEARANEAFNTSGSSKYIGALNRRLNKGNGGAANLKKLEKSKDLKDITNSTIQNDLKDSLETYANYYLEKGNFNTKVQKKQALKYIEKLTVYKYTGLGKKVG